MFVHIGGMDLAGKSTVVNHFARKTDYVWDVQKKFLCNDNPIKAEILSLEKDFDNLEKGWLFFEALKKDLLLFTSPVHNTIQESCIILRSISFHSVEGNMELAEAFKTLLPKHPVFDLSFILTADYDSRLLRLKDREEKDMLTANDKHLFSEIGKLFLMEQVMIDIGQKWFNSRVINTTYLDPGEIVEIILSDIKNSINK